MPNYIHTYTDGGRAAAPGFEHECRDCTVRAYALFFDVSYAEAHAACKRYGRLDKRGMKTSDIKRSLAPHGVSLTYTLWGDRLTLNQFAAAHPTGRHYLVFNRHVAVLQDGVLLDSWKVGPRTRVIWHTTKA